MHNNGHASPWNDPDRVATLGALYFEGVGPTEIARRMGLTKGQVSGRMDRRGMKYIMPKPSSTFEERMDALDRLLPRSGCAYNQCGAEVDAGRRYCARHRVKMYEPLVPPKG